jgi:hypothetical protein
MNGRRLTDAQIAQALRAHLPQRAQAGLRERIQVVTEATPQQRALPQVLGVLSDVDPVVRRRNLLIAAALLVALALAGVVGVGALLLQRDSVTQLSVKPPIVAPSSTPSGPSAAPTASPVTDPAGLWIATGTMGSPRGTTNSCRADGCSSLLHAVRLLDGRVLVVGGSDEWSDPPTAELYDPDSGTWSATGSMLKPQEQDGFLPTVLLDGRVLVGDVDGAELYDPVSGTWSATGKMLTVETNTATLLRDGKVLVTGQSGAQVYDPDSGTWSTTGNMITPRHYHTATLLRDGKVLAVGGYDGGDLPLGSAELYDPDTGSWTAIANTHFDPRPNCVGCGGGGGWATLLQDGTLLFRRTSGELEIYDPATGIWTALAGPTVFDGPSAAGVDRYQTATLLSDGTVLVPGISGPDCTAAPLSSMPRCGGGSSLTLLLDGTVLVAGGEVCNESVDAVTGEHRNSCVSTSAAELYVPAGVSPPPLPAFATPPPPVFPTPTPRPTPLPPAAGPVPPNARSWKVTVDNESSEPVTLFVAEEDESGTLRLVGSATPNVVPAGATVKVTFLFPAKGGPDDGWIYVNPRPGEGGSLVSAADIGIPGKIVIMADPDGQVGWLSP